MDQGTGLAKALPVALKRTQGKNVKTITLTLTLPDARMLANGGNINTIKLTRGSSFF